MVDDQGVSCLAGYTSDYCQQIGIGISVPQRQKQASSALKVNSVQFGFVSLALWGAAAFYF